MWLREVLLKIGKWLTPTIKDKRVTNSNTSIKLWKERKHTIELIPVKSLGMFNVCKLHKHYQLMSNVTTVQSNWIIFFMNVLKFLPSATI